MGRLPLGWLVVGALASGVAVARAETVTKAGFELAVPDRYVASRPDLAAALRGQLTGALAGAESGTLRPDDAEVWAFERPSSRAQVPDRVVLLWMPGDPPATDDASFRTGLEQGLRQAAAGGGELQAFDDRRLPGDVEALEARLVLSAFGVRIRMLLVPRDGFLLMVQQVRAAPDPAGDDGAWAELLAGLRTTAGAPKPGRTAWPYPKLLALGAFAVLALLVVGAIRGRGRPLPVDTRSPEDDDPDFRPPSRPRPPR